MKSLNLFVATIVLTTATAVFAADNGYVPDTNNSVWAQRGWPGEYPGPGLKLTKNVTFKGSAKLTDALTGYNSSPKKCTYVAGNYHPWAKKTKATYASTSQVTTYTAKAKTTIEYYPFDSTEARSLTLEVGEKLRELGYQSEGFCTIEVQGKPASAQCLGMSDDLSADAAVQDYSSYEGQFIYAACSGKGESGSAWIKVDSALFQIDAIEQTEISGYGEIKE